MPVTGGGGLVPRDPDKPEPGPTHDTDPTLPAFCKDASDDKKHAGKSAASCDIAGKVCSFLLSSFHEPVSQNPIRPLDDCLLRIPREARDFNPRLAQFGGQRMSISQ